jgi:hypothetical protein
MSAEPEKWMGRFSVLWTIFIAGIGAVLYYFGYTDSDRPYLKDIGELVAAGAVAAILFEWLSRRQSTAMTRSVVDEALRRVVTPVRARAVSDALSEYRWYVRLELPSKEDPIKDYFVQLVHLTYLWPNIPNAIKIVCAVSNAGGALSRWANDAQKALVWKIEMPGSALDVSDKNVFSIGEVKLNGRTIAPGKGRLVEVSGGHAREHVIGVPPDMVGKLVTFSADIRTRMWAANTGRLFTSSQLYRDVSDGEFIYQISDEIGVREVTPILTEMTPLLPSNEEIISDNIWSLARLKQSARASFSTTMEKGSAIRFEWYRKDGGTI